MRSYHNNSGVKFEPGVPIGCGAEAGKRIVQLYISVPTNNYVGAGPSKDEVK